MIKAVDLFGKKDTTDREKRILKCANLAAQTMYLNRFQESLKEHWDKDASEVTLEDAESATIEAILSKYDYAKVSKG